MIGFPKYIATKQDYLNCVPLFPEQTKASLQQLIDNRFIWFDTGGLEDAESGITDDTHKILETRNEQGIVEYRQMELVEDTNAKIFRLGFTVSEAEEMIGGL